VTSKRTEDCQVTLNDPEEVFIPTSSASRVCEGPERVGGTSVVVVRVEPLVVGHR
jgi:hypothetical protein